MPITIKQNVMSYKNPSTGQYEGFNAIQTEATATQITNIQTAGATQVAAVNSAGATQVSAITTQGATTLASIPQDYTTLSNDVSDLKSASTLQAENIPDTVQTITFDSDGNVQTITHTRDNVAVRTDAFTFTESTITEVRTLSTGESLTIVTNTTTLQTTVTYAAA